MRLARGKGDKCANSELRRGKGPPRTHRAICPNTSVTARCGRLLVAKYIYSGVTISKVLSCRIRFTTFNSLL